MKLILSRWWMAVGLGVMVIVIGAFLSACTDNQPGGTRASAAAVTQSECPVSGQPVNRDVFLDYEGERVYFCCRMCPDKFKADPARYLAVLNGEQAASRSEMQCGSAGSGSSSRMQCSRGEGSTPASATAATYTCPMHPEIVRDAPGSCPKCGMNLVPREE